MLPNLLVHTLCVKRSVKRVCASAHTMAEFSLRLSRLSGKKGVKHTKYYVLDMNIGTFRGFCGLESDFQIITSVLKRRFKSSKINMACLSGRKEK